MSILKRIFQSKKTVIGIAIRTLIDTAERRGHITAETKRALIDLAISLEMMDPREADK